MGLRSGARWRAACLPAWSQTRDSSMKQSWTEGQAFLFFLSIYLAALDLSFGMWDLVL